MRGTNKRRTKYRYSKKHCKNRKTRRTYRKVRKTLRGR